MDIEKPRHLRRQPMALGRATAWILVGAIALWASIEVVELALYLMAVGLVFVAAWRVAVNLGYEHQYVIALGIAGLAIGVVALRPAGSDDPRHGDTADQTDPTTSIDPTTTTPRSVADRSTTTADPTTTTTTVSRPATSDTSTSQVTATTVPPSSTSIHHIVSDGRNGMCLDTHPARVQVSVCENTDDMNWTLEGTQIRRPDSVDCLGLFDGQAVQGGDVTVERCDPNDPGQRWTRHGKALQHGLGGCLDVTNEGDRRRVQSWVCQVADEQNWTITAPNPD